MLSHISVFRCLLTHNRTISLAKQQAFQLAEKLNVSEQELGSTHRREQSLKSRVSVLEEACEASLRDLRILGKQQSTAVVRDLAEAKAQARSLEIEVMHLKALVRWNGGEGEQCCAHARTDHREGYLRTGRSSGRRYNAEGPLCGVFTIFFFFFVCVCVCVLISLRRT